jgi:hypothetical protein
VKCEVSAWQREHNNKEAAINWRFTTADSRIKTKHIYYHKGKYFAFYGVKYSTIVHQDTPLLAAEFFIFLA